LIISPSITEKVLDLAVQIQQIPAATFHERQRAIFIRKCFEELDSENTQMDEYGNVYLRIRGQGKKPAVVVSAHLDTVFPPDIVLSLRRTPKRIYGPGIGDNSLGLASLCALGWIFHEKGAHPLNNPGVDGDIWLVANVGEEGLGNLTGMKAVVEQFGSDPLAYIVLEGMSIGHIYNRGLGVRRYRISVHTKGGHSWVDFGNPSAIHELAKLVVKLNQIPLPVEPRTTLNVGMINGGTSVNTIAAEASCELDLRSEKLQELTRLIDQVMHLMEEINLNTEKRVVVEAEVIGDRPAGEIAVSHPLVQMAMECYKANGIRARLSIGSTDANVPLSRGFPAICIGLTTGGRSHSLEEFIDTKPISKGLGILVDLIKNIFELDNQ
jgi:tripeptide aminopeptidase